MARAEEALKSTKEQQKIAENAERSLKKAKLEAEKAIAEAKEAKLEAEQAKLEAEEAKEVASRAKKEAKIVAFSLPGAEEVNVNNKNLPLPCDSCGIEFRNIEPQGIILKTVMYVKLLYHQMSV